MGRLPRVKPFISVRDGNARRKISVSVPPDDADWVERHTDVPGFSALLQEAIARLRKRYEGKAIEDSLYED